MKTSNLIALGALIVSVVALIPQFHQIFSKRKIEQSKSENEKDSESYVAKETSKIENNKEDKESEEPIPYMLRILMLIVFAVASFLIEIIIFSIITHFNGIEINLDTMTLLWKVIFYSLFFIPGAFLFLALLTLAGNTTD